MPHVVCCVLTQQTITDSARGVVHTLSYHSAYGAACGNPLAESVVVCLSYYHSAHGAACGNLLAEFVVLFF